MKFQLKGLIAYTVVSVMSATLVVACAKSKDAPVKASKVWMEKANQNQNGTSGTMDASALAPQNLKILVSVSNQKPMIDIMQASQADKLSAFMNKAEGPVQESVSMELSLINLKGDDLQAVANGDSNTGAGSILKLKTVLNNSVDQPLVMGMASRTASVTVKDNQMTATFTFLPEHSMQTNAMTVTLNGSVSAVLLTNAKAFSGKVSLADTDGNSVEIGTFSATLDQIMSDTDAALFH